MIYEFDSRPAVVLLVDDDPGDQELTKRALSEGVYKIDLRTAGDGEEAMSYLLNAQDPSLASEYPPPDIVLMDLNMPKMDGRELLEKIRLVPQLKKTVVIVLTTSDQEKDILDSYELGCQSYITKPVSIDGFLRAIEKLGCYWFQLVKLPPR